MGSLGCYLKNIDVVESMDGITAIVFDKTGTLTDPQQMEIIPSGETISNEDQSILFEMTGSSTHPLSAGLHRFLANENLVFVEFDSFNEHIGKGIEVSTKNDRYLLGNAAFTKQGNHSNNELFYTKNGIVIQRFLFKSKFRSDIKSLLSRLSKTKNFVLSGDSDTDLPSLLEIGFKKENIYFLQSPSLKHEFIQKLQSNGEKVMMLGDGLNDASALTQADIGIAISEDMFKFTPSSEAILDAKKLNKLDDFLAISKFSRMVLKICLGFSLVYNISGIIIAVSGMLSPLIAAILMPLSSITIVFLSTSLIFFRFKPLKN
jgi:Cu+-exporting ATPase